MKLNYGQSLTDFWETAPDKPGYKHVYAASFGAIMHLLQESGKRSIVLKYAHLNGMLKLSDEAYSESLKWLDEAGLIVYFKGKGRNAPATVLVNVPEFATSHVTDFQNQQPEISGGNGGGKGVCTGGGSGVSSPVVEQNSSFSPPPYPPIEELNIISPTYLPIGQAGEAGVKSFSKPKNIVLTDEEESDLLTTYGPEFTARMLLLVAAYKRDQGGTLKASDFENCIRWAANRVKENDLKVGLSVTTSRPAPIAKQTTTTRQVFKEWT